MSDPNVKVNVYDDSFSGHVSVSITRADGIQITYERQLDINKLMANAMMSGGGLDGALMLFSPIGEDDGINQIVSQTGRATADIAVFHVPDSQAQAMIDFANKNLGQVDYSLLGGNCFNFVVDILAAGGIGNEWTNQIDNAVHALIIALISEMCFSYRRDHIISTPETVGYLGDEYVSNETERGYVYAYASGNLRGAAKVLVSSCNGDLITNDLNFYPDLILRKQADCEGGVSSSANSGGSILKAADLVLDLFQTTWIAAGAAYQLMKRRRPLEPSLAISSYFANCTEDRGYCSPSNYAGFKYET